MSEKIGKLCSILMIIVLVLSGLLIIIPYTQKNTTVSAASTWTETSNLDFNKGMKSKVDVSGSGTAANIILDSNEWRLLKPNAKPAGRVGHAMATFDETETVLLFGGYSGKVNSDTWFFDFGKENWFEKSPKTQPSERTDHAMAAVYHTDNVVLFGGFDTKGYLKDTWVYDLSLTDWALKIIIGGDKITARAHHAMATIYGYDVVVLFGGSSTKFLGDTWIYDLGDNKWALKSLTTKPTPRRNHAMANFFKDDKVLLFGGETSPGKYNSETWVYDYSDNKWYKKSPKTSPSARHNHSMAPIIGTDKIVLFSGYTGKANDETWVYDLSDDAWTELTPFSSPSARIAHAMANDWKSDNVVLFGGRSGLSISSETWSFDYGKYLTSGTFISAANDTGGNSSFSTLSWNSSFDFSTSIKFRLRSAGTEAGLSSESFLGPDGATTTYYLTSGTSIWSGHAGDRWIQYKAYLATTVTSKTPILKDITIVYNNLPLMPDLITPTKDILLGNNKPTFKWTFNDKDSKGQAGYQVVIDNDKSFLEIDYDSKEVTSEGSAYTPSKAMLDGSWYWKVRTQDSDGSWGPFSDYQKFTIDATPPEPFTPTAAPANWTNNTQPVISFNTTDLISGVDHFEVKIDDGTFSTQTSPYTLPEQPDGVHNITVKAYDVAKNYRQSYVEVFIDSTPPESFTPISNPSIWSTNTQPVITFASNDTTSGLDHYEMSINHGTFSIKTSPYTLNPQPDGLHTITVRAYDVAGNFAEGEVEVKIDTSAPSITHTPVTSGTKGFPITITALVTDEHSGIDQVTLFSKKPAESRYATIIMDADGDTYSYEIPAESVTADGIEYYLKAEDKSSPINVIYFGREGETTLEPASLTDIDISITEDDLTPPSITHIPITQVTLDDTIIIQAAVTDDASGVNQVELSYKKKTDGEYTNLIMTKSVTMYTAEIPAEAKSSDGIEYYIKAMDNAPSPNVAYFGASGQVVEMPNSLTDIDITVIEQDLSAPTVSDKLPVGNDVAVGTTIKVTFSEAMNQPATEGAFSISPAMSGVSSWEANSLLFSPDNPFSYNTQYTVSISTSAKDLADNNLETEFSWQFTTTSVIDVTPPTILDIIPEGTDVSVDTKIAVAFSESMQKEFTEYAFSISPTAKGTFHWVGSTLSFIPTSPLDYETEYFVTISSSKAQDLVGNNLESDYSWSFTTESVKDTTPPTVKYKSPTGFDIPVNTTIQIAFSEEMQNKPTENAFSIIPKIKGTFNWPGDATLTFTPDAPLTYSTIYNVTISTGAKNLMGNNLEEDVSWSFTTMKEPVVDGGDGDGGDGDGNGGADGIDKGSGDKESQWDVWEPIITILTIIGTVIATLIGFYRLRRKQTKLRKFLDKIDSTFNSYKMNYQTCEKELITLKDTIKKEFQAGKIEDNHYLILDKKIDDYLSDMRLTKMEEDSEVLKAYKTRAGKHDPGPRTKRKTTSTKTQSQSTKPKKDE
jgi:N-acetylneuraminic acid mutarotase